MEQVVIYGAGGHAKVVLDIVEQEGTYCVQGLLDKTTEFWGTERWGYSVIGDLDKMSALRTEGVKCFFVALGDNRERKRVYQDAVIAEFEMISIVHPSVQVGGRVVIGDGCLLVAGAVVNVDARIDQNVIVNTGATIDHDCHIGAHSHISPGVHLAGNVVVGELSHIGIGAVVLPSMSIGNNCVVGAGAVVRENVPDGMVVAGNPARLISPMEDQSHGC
jgi:acetyltransferase EpsM